MIAQNSLVYVKGIKGQFSFMNGHLGYARNTTDSGKWLVEFCEPIKDPDFPATYFMASFKLENMEKMIRKEITTKIIRKAIRRPK